MISLSTRISSIMASCYQGSAADKALQVNIIFKKIAILPCRTKQPALWVGLEAEMVRNYISSLFQSSFEGSVQLVQPQQGMSGKPLLLPGLEHTILVQARVPPSLLFAKMETSSRTQRSPHHDKTTHASAGLPNSPHAVSGLPWSPDSQLTCLPATLRTNICCPQATAAK